MAMDCLLGLFSCKLASDDFTHDNRNIRLLSTFSTTVASCFKFFENGLFLNNVGEPTSAPLSFLHFYLSSSDMNIWLHQAVKSRAGNSGPQTYLAILFRRLCKLIYFGIRPVFVFDGDVPALKRSTMVSGNL